MLKGEEFCHIVGCHQADDVSIAISDGARHGRRSRLQKTMLHGLSGPLSAPHAAQRGESAQQAHPTVCVGGWIR